jgi:membrane associated rhomboid family serine protease
MRRVSALILIGVWFLLQLLDGILSTGDAATSSGGVAYWAHVGGFIFGLVATYALMYRRALSPASG